MSFYALQRKRVLFWGVFALAIVPFFAGAAVRAEVRPLNLDLAQDHVNITTGFTGSVLSVFGTRQGRGDIVIILEGQIRDSIVRRKENVAGAWINRSWLRFRDIPVYYDYASSRSDEKGLLPEKELARNRIGLDSFRANLVSNRYDAETTKDFQNALLRNKQERGLFPREPQKIVFIDDNFFRVDFHLPSNVPRGKYSVRALLIRDKRVVHEIKRDMTVAQIGFSSTVNSVAHSHSLFYGLLCVFIACMAGWLSNAVVRRD